MITFLAKLFCEIRALACALFLPQLSPYWRARRRLEAGNGWDKRTCLFVLNLHHRGGEERSASSYIRALADEIGIDKFLVVAPDYRAVQSADWLPTGCKLIVLLACEHRLCYWERAAILAEVMIRTSPGAVFVFNSAAFWHAFAVYRLLIKPSRQSKIVLYMGGYELYVQENYKGFLRGGMSRNADRIDLFITDNERLKAAVIDRFRHINGIRRKVVTLLKGLTPELHQALISKRADCRLQSSAKILWAGRLHPAKRPDLLEQIARAMPDVKFEIYGRAGSGVDFASLIKLANVELKGEYTDFSQIPVADKTAFLHTSASDGLPNSLLEAAAAGLPLVSSAAGAISEFVSDETGWLIHGNDNVDAYVSALRFIIENDDLSSRRAQRARDLVQERHSWRSFVCSLTTLAQDQLKLSSPSEDRAATAVT